MYRRVRHGCAVVVVECSPETAEGAKSQLDGTLLYEEAPLSVGYATNDKRDHLFPHLDFNIRSQIKLDSTAIYSVTDQTAADRMTALLWGISQASVIKPALLQELKITDSMACIGGNSISFAQTFPLVRSIEMHPTRFGFLQNNITVCGLASKTELVNADYSQICNEIKQDILFLDPPWGGTGYSQEKVIPDLLLGEGMWLNDYLVRLGVEGKCDVAMAKLPKNYDCLSLCKRIVHSDDPKLMERHFPYVMDFGATKVVLICYNGKRPEAKLRFRNRNLDAVIAKMNEWDAANLKEHKPVFYDFEKEREIPLSKWKGCKLE